MHTQSHGGQVWPKPEDRDRCDDLVEAADPGRFARRPLLRAAVLGHPDVARAHATAYESLLRPRPAAERTVTAGTVSDVSPHVLIVETRDGEERLALTPATVVWRGARVSPTALRHGDQVIIRKGAARGQSHRGGLARRVIAERVWAEIGRVTGTILEARPASEGPAFPGGPRGLELLVDGGRGKTSGIVLIAREVYRQILVRFPRLEPGYLIDVIGLRRPGYLQALTPATSQPAYRADHPPAPPLVNGHVPDAVSGTAAWHEPGDEPASLQGLAYPAVDPETGCDHDHAGWWSRAARRPEGGTPRGSSDSRAGSAGPVVVDPHSVGLGCVRLPYLSVGSVLTVRNDCTGLSVPLPVTSCGAAARLFCDRCVECRTSPRGRIADLTISAFVQLGGLLENGCFNASLNWI
jgi:hypothetical protein